MKTLSQVIIVACMLQIIVIANIYSFEVNTLQRETQNAQVIELTGIIG